MIMAIFISNSLQAIEIKRDNFFKYLLMQRKHEIPIEIYGRFRRTLITTNGVYQLAQNDFVANGNFIKQNNNNNNLEKFLSNISSNSKLYTHTINKINHNSDGRSHGKIEVLGGFASNQSNQNDFNQNNVNSKTNEISTNQYISSIEQRNECQICNDVDVQNRSRFPKLLIPIEIIIAQQYQNFH